MYEKPKETTYKTEQFKRLDHSKQSIIQKIEIVFVFYCGKGSKYNYQELQQKYFMEMATELFILAGKEQQFNRKSKKWIAVATLYYTKGIKKPLYHNQFLELLPGLARQLFLEQGSPRKSLQYQFQEQKAMKNLLYLFQKLYSHITDQQLYKRGIKSQQIEEQTKQFLLKLRDSLTRLYKVYFQYQTTLTAKQKDYQNKSFDCYLQIMKDFDVYPKLISAAQLYFIYNQVNHQREHYHLTLLSPSLYTRTAFTKLGEYFTLTRFVESLILVSHICVGKLKRAEGQQLLYTSVSMSQKELVKLLLEYMETMRSIKQKYYFHQLHVKTIIETPIPANKFKNLQLNICCVLLFWQILTQVTSQGVYQEYSDYTSKNKRTQSLKSSPQANQTKRSFYQILDKMDL